MNKVLNLVLSKVPESDCYTGDPIRETGLNKIIKEYRDGTILDDFFLYVIKLGDKHCTKIDYGNAFLIGEGILKSVNPEYLDKVRNNKAKILLSWPLESFVQDRIFELMHNYFEYHKVPISGVIYLSCCPNGSELYETFCRKYNIIEKINIEYIPWYLYSARNHKSEEYSAGKKKKIFFNLNRRMHSHRSLFLLMVYKLGIMDKFYISFPKTHPNSSETFFMKVTRNYLTHFKKYGITEDDVAIVDQQLPMQIDIKNWDVYPLPIRTDKLDIYYQKSLFSIVSETYFFSKIIHLTEKTFKPIINRHPFIMIAAPYTLQKIKDFGFKTFDNVINERYDRIENDEERFDEILRLITEMSQWDRERVAYVSQQVKDIVDYNYNLLQTRPREELNSFIEKYGTSIKGNNI